MGKTFKNVMKIQNSYVSRTTSKGTQDVKDTNIFFFQIIVFLEFLWYFGFNSCVLHTRSRSSTH